MSREYEAELSRAISAGRLSHAILLVGDAYVCDRVVDFACTQLLSMTEAEIKMYPDIHCFEGQKMTADLGGTVDTIIEELQKAPFGKKRIWYIKNAGYMSVMVQNKLLKTIEEPTPNNVFFLSGMVDFLLPTVLSRCTRLNIACPTREEATEYVQRNASLQGEGITVEVARKCAMLTENDIAEATELAVSEEYAEFFTQAVGYICGMKKNGMVTGDTDTFAKSRDTALSALRIFSRCVSDMLHVKLGLPLTVFSGSRYAGELELCANRLEERAILAVSELICKAYSDIFSNSSAKQVLTHLAARIEQEI